MGCMGWARAKASSLSSLAVSLSISIHCLETIRPFATFLTLDLAFDHFDLPFDCQTEVFFVHFVHFDHFQYIELEHSRSKDISDGPAKFIPCYLTPVASGPFSHSLVSPNSSAATYKAPTHRTTSCQTVG
jgi:hypothetical protein